MTWIGQVFEDTLDFALVVDLDESFSLSSRYSFHFPSQTSHAPNHSKYKNKISKQKAEKFI